jgi:hypothetical protein
VLDVDVTESFLELCNKKPKRIVTGIDFSDHWKGNYPNLELKSFY